MNKPAIVVVLTCALTSASCATAPAAVTTITSGVSIFCGIADVVLSNTDSKKIKQTIGDATFADFVCDLFLPSGADSPTPTGVVTVTRTIASGEEITAAIVPK